MFRISIFLSFFSLLFLSNLDAQSAKEIRPAGQKVDASQKKLKERNHAPAVPTTSDPFNIGTLKYSPQPLNLQEKPRKGVVLRDADTGLPYFIQQTTDFSAIKASESETYQAKAYLASLDLEAIQNASSEFEVVQSKLDEQNNYHIRFQQMWKGLEVYGAEVIVHSHKGAFDLVNGRYVPSPTVIASVKPVIEEAAAIQTVRTTMDDSRVWTTEELRIVSGKTHTATLLIYIKDNIPHLAYHITARPDPMHRVEYFMDANTGEVLNTYDNTCKIDGGLHAHKAGHTADVEVIVQETGITSEAPNLAGPVIATGVDLLNINRTFGAYESSGTVYLEDTRKSMFKASASQMPNEPVGAIVTLDALNNSPQKPNFNYTVVTSNGNTFSNKKAAVSAHWNSNLCFDYFKNTHNRNSIDGSGGNILAFINVAEDDGTSMENAFWNGEAMWYGNGGSFFKPLAAGLDVGGHEMTHGVIEKTANLVYQNESGALNESFADIFGVMIDRDDWKIGEDVMQSGVSPNGALRSMEDPHNGASNSNSQWWQPKHYNERYTGSQDNGGVHINSGITNYAFYLFANNSGVGKDKAEKVYYKALDDYLVKSSRFTDSRAAVVQAATDLYGNAVAQVAADAFTAVGIQGASPGGGGNPNPNPGGNYLNDLAKNPGLPFILVTTEDKQELQLADASGNILGTLYDQGVASRASITDNGSEVVFINNSNQIVDIFLEYGGGNITPTTQVISQDPVWRNVAISKDGRFIAALTTDNDKTINIFDFGVSPVQTKVFSLYNPTYTNGQVTDNVNFADVLEFDYSGEFLMYDAENALTSSQGQDLSYWDIGFLQFFDNNQWTDGVEDISKLFNGLPEGLSVGNPVFSKNSPYIIALDVIDGLNNDYSIFGANIETGDNSAIVIDNGDLGYPNFDGNDNNIIYDSPSFLFGKNLKKQALAANKISPSGSSSTLVSSRVWGVWFANGARSLQVDAKDIANVENWLKLSPNPTQSESFLDVVLDKSAEATLSVFDVAGKLVQSKQVGLTAGANRLSVDVASLKAGTYFVTLQTSNRKAVVQLVKM